MSVIVLSVRSRIHFNRSLSVRIINLVPSRWSRKSNTGRIFARNSVRVVSYVLSLSLQSLHPYSIGVLVAPEVANYLLKKHATEMTIAENDASILYHVQLSNITPQQYTDDFFI